MINKLYTQETVNIWFPNQKEPIYDSEDPKLLKKFKDYWDRERERMREGFKIGGVYISGWLYWHTVYYKIVRYKELATGKLSRKVRMIGTPDFRDIEWDVGQDFLKCEADGRFYILVGSRDFGKSVIAASRAAWLYTLFSNSESVISGGAKDYIKLATDKIEDGLMNLHPVLQKRRLASNWDKEVRAGWKDKKSNQPSPKSSNSVITVRNYEMGNNTMAANGTRPGFHLIDEIGTLPNLISCVKDSDGCWWSGGGDKPSCLVMLAGTGGDMEVGAEASEIFYTPEAYNVLAFDNIWEPGTPGRIGRFVPATKARMKYKEPKTLAEYIGVDHPDLQKITILVSNEERALKEWWEVEYAKARKSGNSKTILKFKAYWPLKPSDSFLVLTKNDFNVEAAAAQQARLRGVGTTGTPVELSHDGERIIHKFTDKVPITQFPVKDQDTDAPVVIWEFPVDENPPFGLYTAGVDPYSHSIAESSDSLGAVYIFKRMHDIQGEKYQNMFVASYVARPNDKEKWNETARLLIKYYNAYTLVENDQYSFIDYMIKKGDAARYLCPQPSWLREIVPNTTVNRDYGIHRSAERVRAHLDGLLKKYLDEVIYVEKDKEGSIIKEILGVNKVFDPMLLEEIKKFSFDGNFDRVVAAELAVALADHLNPQFVVAEIDKDPRLKAYFDRNKVSSRSVIDFSVRHSVLGRGKKRSKLFL